MKLRELLNTMNEYCDALITIVGYCEKVKYDYTSERVTNDFFTEMIEKGETSIILEPWYPKIMDKEVECFGSYCDEENNKAVVVIVISKENDNEVKFDRITDVIVRDFQIFEDYKNVINICKKDGLNKLDALIEKFNAHKLVDGLSKEEALVKLEENFKCIVKGYQKELSKYYDVFKDRKDFLIADCKNEGEVKLINKWLEEWNSGINEKN